MYYQEDNINISYEKPLEIKVGDVVFVSQLGKNATIEKIIKKQLGKSEKIAQNCEKYFLNLQLIFEVN